MFDLGSGSEPTIAGACPHQGCALQAYYQPDGASGHCPVHGWFLQGRCPEPGCSLFAIRTVSGAIWQCRRGTAFYGALCPSCRGIGVTGDGWTYHCAGAHAFAVRVGGCWFCAGFGNMTFDAQRTAWICEACLRAES